jgi:hypothetical protein
MRTKNMELLRTFLKTIVCYKNFLRAWHTDVTGKEYSVKR